METINQRIKQVRKSKNLTQRAFSEKLGVTQSGVSYMEQDGRKVSDITIKSICNLFSVNEEWLRNGTNPMFIKSHTFNLDEYLKEKGASDLEIDIIKTYFDFDQDTRKKILQFFKEHFVSSSKQEQEMVQTKMNTEKEMQELTYIKNHLDAVQNMYSTTSSDEEADTENIRKQGTKKKIKRK